MTKLSELSQESTYLLSLVDITMIQKEKDLLEYYTYTDPLTKLNNRKKLEEDIERLIDNSKDFSIVMVSVNGLNDINDKYGFVSGENLLIELASMIKKSTLDYGHLYRWESEEFFILSEKSFDTLLEGATSIKDNVARSIFVDVGKIDCSFAITTHRQGDTQKSIISRVDQGLCKSKDSKNLEII
jgi:diguanylate cyclase (GGDEF)-like protein